VNDRSLLILTVAGFVVFVTALSLYMSVDPAPERPIRTPGLSADLADDNPGARQASMREEFSAMRRAREEASQRQLIADRSPAPAHGRAAAWRGQIMRLAGRLDEAASRARSNLADAPAARLLAGAAEVQAGQPIAAVEQFDRILARSPNDVTALSAKAAALVEAGRFDAAVEAYAALVRLAPEDTAAAYNFGVVSYRLGRYGEAEEQFRRAVRIDPRHAAAWYNLATLAQRFGRLAEAREAWRQFLDLRPEASGGWFNLGVVWMDFDEPMQAVECFSRAAALKPDDRDGWLNLGLAYAAAEHWTAALAAMNRADAVAPCDPLVMSCLAQLHAAIADLGGPDAEVHRRMAAELEPNLTR
jgi:tetratricopeptide (TPR) repeat protein